MKTKLMQSAADGSGNRAWRCPRSRPRMTWKQSLLAPDQLIPGAQPPLALHFNVHLGTSAQAHSNNMARYHLFEPLVSNGVSWCTRIRYYGYRGR